MQRSPEYGGSGLDERVDALATWIDEIADRVRATELANGDEKTARELRRAIEVVAKHDPKLEGRLTNRIDVLADRLGTLASAVSTTSAELARRDGEVAALHRELEQGNSRIQTLGGELGRVASVADLDRLDKAIALLAADRPSRKDDDQTERLAAKVDYLTERVDTLAKTVAATAAGLAGREGELATLRQRLDERAKHFEQALVELGQPSGEATLGQRLDTLESALETVAVSLAQLENGMSAERARSDEAYGHVGSAVTALQRSAAGLAAQVGAAEERGQAMENALEELATSFGGKVANLAARLDSIEGGVESSVAGFAAELVDRQATRLDRIERDHHDLATEWASKVEAMTATLADIGARDYAGELELQLAERLRSVDQRDAAAASEIARVSAFWASEFEGLTTRLDEVAVIAQDGPTRDDPAAEQLLSDLSTRLDAVVHERQAVAAQIAQASENEVAELRLLIDGLRTRFEPSEQGYAGSPYERGRLDEPAGWLDANENLYLQPGVESDPGDGRLRLELRALELRAERAEQAAQQNRDAVLAQLERMTEQLESRFQKLESDTASSSRSEAGDQAEVVQLRGAEV